MSKTKSSVRGHFLDYYFKPIIAQRYYSSLFYEREICDVLTNICEKSYIFIPHYILATVTAEITARQVKGYFKFLLDCLVLFGSILYRYVRDFRVIYTT